MLLIDTILSPIDKADTTLYNPFELLKEPKGSVFVFYCDSGKATLDRIQEYKKKFPNQELLSQLKKLPLLYVHFNTFNHSF